MAGKPRTLRRDRSRRINLEYLECRLAPAVFNPAPSAADGAGDSLRDDINQADSNGDAANTINLAAGTYSLTDSKDGNLLIENSATSVPSKTFTIVGQGPGKSIIQGGSSFANRIFQIVGATLAGNSGFSVNVVLMNLTVTGGRAHGEGIGSTIPTRGGGMLIDGAAVSLSNASVSKNNATGANGTGYVTTANAVKFTGTPGGYGGAAEGGGIYLASGDLILTLSSVVNNQALGGRGANGLYGKDPGVGGYGGDGLGGGIYVGSGTVTLNTSTIDKNQAVGGQGGSGGFGTASGVKMVYFGPSANGSSGETVPRAPPLAKLVSRGNPGSRACPARMSQRPHRSWRPRRARR